MRLSIVKMCSRRATSTIAMAFDVIGVMRLAITLILSTYLPVSAVPKITFDGSYLSVCEADQSELWGSTHPWSPRRARSKREATCLHIFNLGAYAANKKFSLTRFDLVPISRTTKDEVYSHFSPSDTISMAMPAVSSWWDSNIAWASRLSGAILVSTEAAHIASSLSSSWLFYILGPQCYSFSGSFRLVSPDIGVETFSHSDNNTQLSLPPTRLKQTAWELTHYSEASPSAEPDERCSSQACYNLGRYYGCLVRVTLAKLGGMVFWNSRRKHFSNFPHVWPSTCPCSLQRDTCPLWDSFPDTHGSVLYYGFTMKTLLERLVEFY